MLVRPEDVMFAASKVRMDLTRQQRILRDVRVAGIAVQWQEQQPDDTDDDADD